MFDNLKRWAKAIKRDVITLWFARNHSQTPLLAKLLSFVAVAYVLSPIDLIPDFIPVLGYLDELIVVPVLIWLALRLLPAEVVADSRAKADVWIAGQHRKPVSIAGAVLVVGLWCLLVYFAWHWYWRAADGP